MKQDLRLQLLAVALHAPNENMQGQSWHFISSGLWRHNIQSRPSAAHWWSCL